MGVKDSKYSDAPLEDELNKSQRETLKSWYRKGVPMTDVYDVIELIGDGHMGEVYKVRRKSDGRGLHNENTRLRKVSSQPEFEEKPKKGKVLSKLKKKSKKKNAKSEDVNPEFQLEVEKKKIPPKLSTTPKPKSILRSSSYAGSITAEMSQTDIEIEEKSDEGESDGDMPQKTLFPSPVLPVRSQSESSAIEVTSSMLKNREKVHFQRLYACKTLITSRVKEGQLDELLNEIKIMRTLDHPYILHLHEVYQVKRKLWLITELCTGGDLTSRNLNEAEVTVVLEQILRAVAYMHRFGICHHDIKLENILYEHNGADATIRLIDFGLSQKYDRHKTQRKAIATAYTLSPEIAAGTSAYTQKTDMWAVGVVVWIMLSGDFPFVRETDDLNNKEKRNKLVNANFTYGITWRGRGISSHAKTFVARCLKKDPESRWTSKEALEFLEQEWIPALQANLSKVAEKVAKQKEGKDGKWINANVDAKSKKSVNSAHLLKKTLSSKRRAQANDLDIDMNDIERFVRYGRMKKTILMVMANTMDRGDLKRLEEIFISADTQNTGTINFIELKEALSKVTSASLDDAKVDHIFKGIDHDQTGQIHYAEFLAALAESQGLVTMNRLAEAFDRIDTEGKGFIAHDDLKNILGKDYDKKVVDDMIKEADFKNNGQIDYEELLQLMFEDPGAGNEAVGKITIQE